MTKNIILNDVHVTVYENGVIYYGDKICKQYDNGYGYLQVIINKKRLYAHRIVATAFIELVPGKPYVNHIDGNKCNNNYKNLEWCTAKENSRHFFDNNSIKQTFSQNIKNRGYKGETHGRHILTEKDVILIRSSSESNKCLADKYGVHIDTIRKVLNRINWKHI